MLGICVNHGNAIHEAIIDTGQFSIDVTGFNIVAVKDYADLALCCP